MKPSPLPPPERNRLIKLIHTAARSLGLSEDDYRAVLEGVTGKKSCKNMDDCELNHVAERMRQLGFTPSAAPTKRKKKLSPRTRHIPAERQTQHNKIRALWINAYQVGAVADRYEDGLNRFVKRLIGVERLDWVHAPADLNKVIEALKAMIQRKETEEP